jgi:hypothetical protein
MTERTVRARLRTATGDVRGAFTADADRWRFTATGEPAPRATAAWVDTASVTAGWANPLGRRLTIKTADGALHVLIARLDAAAVAAVIAMQEAAFTRDQAERRAAHQAEVRAFNDACRTRQCPRCRAEAFTGTSTFAHSVSFSGGGGGSVYTLAGQCGACGHELHITDLR